MCACPQRTETRPVQPAERCGGLESGRERGPGRSTQPLPVLLGQLPLKEPIPPPPTATDPPRKRRRAGPAEADPALPSSHWGRGNIPLGNHYSVALVTS